jgi:hypothetical protein
MKKQTLIDPLLTGMYDPMPDGLRPSVDQTPPDVLYEKYEQGFERAVEFMRRDMPPLVEMIASHLERKYCADCADWRPAHDFSKACSWLCTKHWKLVKQERNRQDYQKRKIRGRV